MKKLLAILTVVLMMAGAAQPAVAGFVDNFDTGYTTEDQPLNSPWFDVSPWGLTWQHTATGVTAAEKLSGNWSATTTNNPGPVNTGYHRTDAARPLNVPTTNTSLVWLTSWKIANTANNAYGRSALTPVSAVDTYNGWGENGGASWAGALSINVTQNGRIVTYYVDSTGTLDRDDVYPTGLDTAVTSWLDVRVTIPVASGATTATVEWKPSASGTWNPVSTVALDSAWGPTYMGIGAAHGYTLNDVWIDDVSISSIPEPVTLLTLAMGLVAVALKRRSR